MRKLIVFVALVAATIGGQLFGQTTIFVSTSGDDANNGATWETAKATLAGALTAATGNTHIYMMVGNYACNDVIIPSGVTVTGGYVNTSTGTDTTLREYPGENSRWGNTTLCTILDAGQTSRVATINNGGKLEGCVVTDGKVTDKGGGVLINGGVVMHCVIINNVALENTNLSAKGGGAYICNNGSLLNCVVAKNYANNGPAVAGADGTLTNNTITANIAVANCGIVTDIDGNVYGTIVIGNQCWMAENLRTTRYANGSLIPLGTWPSGQVCRFYPNGQAQNVNAYGYLYNWNTAMNFATSSNSNPSNRQGVCPVGWHLPSVAEWEQLISYVNAQNIFRCVGDYSSYNYIAKSLASTVGWNNSITDCAVGNDPNSNNLTGFSAMPAGSFGGGGGGDYYSFGGGATFWSSTAVSTSTTDARYFSMGCNSNSVSIGSWYMSYNYSVRCLRN